MRKRYWPNPLKCCFFTALFCRTYFENASYRIAGTSSKSHCSDLQDVSILIERPKTAQHGDFATNWQ